MTIKTESATTHRPTPHHSGRSHGQDFGSSLSETEEDYIHYAQRFDSTAPPPYQTSTEAGPSNTGTSDRASLEELSPAPISQSTSEDEERRPLLPSSSAEFEIRKARRHWRRRIKVGLLIILVSLLASTVTYLIITRKRNDKSIYVPAPLPDPNEGTVIASANWSSPRRMQRAGTDSSFYYSAAEFLLPASELQDLSLLFLSSGTSFTGLVATTDVLPPAKDTIVIRAEAYYSDLEMLSTLSLTQFLSSKKGINWQGIATHQSSGNEWDSSKVLDISLMLILPKEMRNTGRAAERIKRLQLEGVLGFLGGEEYRELIVGEVKISSTCPIDVRTLTSSGDMTLFSKDSIRSGSRLQSGGILNVSSEKGTLHLEKVDSSSSISLRSLGDIEVAYASSPEVSIESKQGAIGSFVAISNSLSLVASSGGIQCGIDLLSPSPEVQSSKSNVSVSAKAATGFVRINYLKQDPGVTLYSKVETRFGGVRVSHPDFFQGSFSGETTKGDLELMTRQGRRIVVDEDRKEGEGEILKGRVWQLDEEKDRRSRTWGHSEIKGGESRLLLEF